MAPASVMLMRCSTGNSPGVEEKEEVWVEEKEEVWTEEKEEVGVCGKRGSSDIDESFPAWTTPSTDERSPGDSGSDRRELTE